MSGDLYRKILILDLDPESRSLISTSNHDVTAKSNFDFGTDKVRFGNRTGKKDASRPDRCGARLVKGAWRGGAQEQNEALLRQLHEREGAIRELMGAAGAPAARVAAFVASLDARWRASPPHEMLSCALPHSRVLLLGRTRCVGEPAQ